MIADRASCIVSLAAIAFAIFAGPVSAAQKPYVGTAEDFMQINQLFSKYNYDIDNGDGVAWAGDFTEDGVFQDPSWCAIGREALIGVVGREPHLGRDLEHRHVHSLGPIVYIDKDHATVHSTVVLVTETGFGKTGGISITGTYDDKLSRVNGEWKFAYRFVQRPSRTPPIPCSAKR
ncbi:MAG: hypothetical protein B7Y99_11930 [Caulobacterales bacterium 32-69-10]|nr:MAG: hypothetical protein B7Y99_11930 [Caulobacterales bacterium 32-69-10]